MARSRRLTLRLARSCGNSPPASAVASGRSSTRSPVPTRATRAVRPYSATCWWSARWMATCMRWTARRARSCGARKSMTKWCRPRRSTPAPCMRVPTPVTCMRSTPTPANASGFTTRPTCRCSACVATDGVVMFGSDDGNVLSLRGDTGAIQWKIPITKGLGRTDIQKLNDADDTLQLDDNILYATAYHGELTAIDATQGQIAWNRSFSSYVGVGVADKQLVGVDDDSLVWAFSKDGGGDLWKQDA